MLYFDYAAHTPASEEVLRAFCEANFIGNPNSAHGAGREAKARMDAALSQIAELLGVCPSELILTSGATESNNLAVKGLAWASRHAGRHIISTPIEHPSVSGALTALQEQGWEIDLLRVRPDGTADIDELRALIRKDTVLVSVCAVDSELGAVQPICEIAEIVKTCPNCRLHVDATQALGKIPFSFEGADAVSLSPHKFFGLCGSGILYLRDGVVLEPLLHGGSGTTLYRSGTPAVALAASMEKALELALPAVGERFEYVSALNRKLRAALSACPAVRINSPAAAVPHILNLSVAGIRGADFQKKLDEHGVCVSVKSACSAPNTPSRAVFAVSQDRKNALSSWRVSLSHLTTEAEIGEFMRQFELCCKEFANAQRI